MKKLIITIVVIAALGGGYVWLRAQRLELGALDATFGTVRRGDLTIPIKASGKIQPKSKREIKSKASGEIIAVHFEAGRMVRESDVLVDLKRDDEQRNKDAAEAARDQAQIALDSAEITLKDRQLTGVVAAEAARDSAAAGLARIKAEYDFKNELRKNKPEMIPPVEWETIEAQYKDAEAKLRNADVEVKKAKEIAIPMAQKEVERAKSALVSAEKKLEDAQERLRETTVRSPIDGMVLQVFRNVGEMIQSGTQSLTGGTVLMEIADVSEIYMVASVDEADIGKVRAMAPPQARPGFDARAATQPTSRPLVTQDTVKEQTPVEISVEAFPDERFEGVIERISPESEIQAAVATFEVRIRITSPNRDKIRGLAGIQAEAKFTSVPVKNALLVPYEAVMRGPTGGLGVYVPVTKPGAAGEEPEFRPCKFGSDNGVDVVVVSGLEEGQRVYTKLPIKTRSEKKAEGEDAE
jgi:HlyD family secretion protein